MNYGEKIMDELPLIKEWKKVYKERDIEDVIKEYERSKARQDTIKEHHRSRVTHEADAAEERAVSCLKEILHKKLFNLEYLWRAKKIDLPVKNLWEFLLYQSNIFRCTFIEPITQEEIDEYIKYWLSDDYRDFPDSGNFERMKDLVKGQKYEGFNEHIEEMLSEGAHYPHWYAWYDRCFGTRDLLDLEDLRLPEEQVFTHAYSMKHDIDLSPLLEGLKNLNFEQQHLFPDPHLYYELAQAIEDTRMLAYFKDLADSQVSSETTDANFDLWYLDDLFYREVPIEAHSDWRAGISATARRELQTAALKRLPELYKQYLDENYFYDRYFDEEKWNSHVQDVETWESMYEEGRQYIRENPEKFGGSDNR